MRIYFFSCRPDQVFHVAVMPCFDKKLEASRSDFYDSVYHSKDVDCVLTTSKSTLFS